MNRSLLASTVSQILRAVPLVLFVAILAAASSAWAAPKQLLLIGSKPDGHPAATHEYMPAMKIIAALLKRVPNLQTKIVQADDVWQQGPKLLKQADGAVMFLTEGARWTQTDQRRIDALAHLATRGGGLVVLHWGMGTRDAKYIDGYLKLLGGCHGGPDRRYKVLTTEVKVADAEHPITRGIKDFRAREEFYYKLKFVRPAGSVRPVLNASIDGADETVAWSWQRPDGGRSFGFSGLHFHDNWQLAEYRRLVAQGILWSMKIELPEGGLNVDVDPALLKLKPATGK